MKPHVKQLRDLHTSPDSCRAIKSGRIRLATYVVRMREKRHAWRILVGKPGRKSILGRSGHSWDCSVEMCFNPYPANVENMVSS